MRPRHICRGNFPRYDLGVLERGLASMRPRHICRGNASISLRQREMFGCFNEAAAYMPRKHGLLCAVGLVAREASMRPRHICRGNTC